MPLGSIFHKRTPSTPKRHTRTVSTPLAELFVEPEEPKTPITRSRSKTLLSTPRTPLAKLFTSFGGKGSESWSRKYTPKGIKEEEEENVRPGSASSSYSSSSDSSFESMLTMATDYTIPEEQHGEGPQLLPAATIHTKPVETHPQSSSLVDNRRKQDKELQGIRDVEWTREMDGHLWRTYTMYQSDPTVTPFFVVPGGVPPLGVCLRVSRAAKKTWREAKYSGGSERRETRTPTGRSRGRRARTPLVIKAEEGVEARAAGGNRGDIFRKSALHRWPASEAATRKRLRILCRRQYGPARNPYHSHQEHHSRSQRRSRNRSVNPQESIPEGLLFSSPNTRSRHDNEVPVFGLFDNDASLPGSDALLSSTRSMELSLATSTSMSMQPDGALAAISGGLDIQSSMINDPDATEDESELIASKSLRRVPSLDEPAFSNDIEPPSVGDVLATVGLGYPVPPRNEPRLRLPGRRSRAANMASRIEPPVLLSPLQIGPSASPYATWPRRRRRPQQEEEEEQQDEEPSFQFQRKAAPVRQSLGDLFGEPSTPPRSSTTPVAPAPLPRSRVRGFTISAGSSNSMGGRRRLRPSPIVPPLPAWAYESPDGTSDKPNLAQLLGAQPMSAGFAPPRLGSPFPGDIVGKGKGRVEFAGDDVPGDCSSRPLTAYSTGVSMLGIGSEADVISDAEEKSRPMKRVRE